MKRGMVTYLASLLLFALEASKLVTWCRGSSPSVVGKLQLRFKTIMPGGADRFSPGEQLGDVTGVHINLRNGAQHSSTEELVPRILGPRLFSKLRFYLK